VWKGEREKKRGGEKGNGGDRGTHPLGQYGRNFGLRERKDRVLSERKKKDGSGTAGRTDHSEAHAMKHWEADYEKSEQTKRKQKGGAVRTGGDG